AGTAAGDGASAGIGAGLDVADRVSRRGLTGRSVRVRLHTLPRGQCRYRAVHDSPVLVLVMGGFVARGRRRGGALAERVERLSECRVRRELVGYSELRQQRDRLGAGPSPPTPGRRAAELVRRAGGDLDTSHSNPCGEFLAELLERSRPGHGDVGGGGDVRCLVPRGQLGDLANPAGDLTERGVTRGHPRSVDTDTGRVRVPRDGRDDMPPTGRTESSANGDLGPAGGR